VQDQEVADCQKVNMSETNRARLTRYSRAEPQPSLRADALLRRIAQYEQIEWLIESRRRRDVIRAMHAIRRIHIQLGIDYGSDYAWALRVGSLRLDGPAPKPRGYDDDLWATRTWLRLALRAR
jgi:hypothetical protein